jgi:hypothetical protein
MRLEAVVMVLGGTLALSGGCLAGRRPMPR